MNKVSFIHQEEDFVSKPSVVTQSKGKVITELLSLETTVKRPSEEIIKKILNLSGLLETNNVSPSWRNNDVKATKRGFRGDSFHSLPNISPQSSPLTPSSSFKPMQKVQSSDSISSRSSLTKYVSKYKNSEQQVEEKILNTIILSKLNKFSAATYNEIRDFLFQILGSEDSLNGDKEKNEIQEFVKEFMKLVFKKAASEEIFCPLYAKLLGEISEKYPIILEEMNKLHENYLEIFEEGEEEEKGYEGIINKNREKKYRQGYSQFLAELTAIKILQIEKLTIIFDKIFYQIVLQGVVLNKTILIEQYIDCLLRIAKVLRKKNETFYVELRSVLLEKVCEIIEGIINQKEKYISISSKSRFLLMDIKDYLKGL